MMPSAARNLFALDDEIVPVYYEREPGPVPEEWMRLVQSIPCRYLKPRIFTCQPGCGRIPDGVLYEPAPRAFQILGPRPVRAVRERVPCGVSAIAGRAVAPLRFQTDCSIARAVLYRFARSLAFPEVDPGRPERRDYVRPFEPWS